jgi:hypothetical protein
MDSKTKNVTYTPQNILTNPCDSGIPTTGCFDATFTGFKAHIERTPCLSTDAVKAICCDQCGCKKEECEMCLLKEWMGQKIVLELHHIDGNRFNNDLLNLQILCPNCHSQTDTYRSKNRS